MSTRRALIPAFLLTLALAECSPAAEPPRAPEAAGSPVSHTQRFWVEGAVVGCALDELTETLTCVAPIETRAPSKRVYVFPLRGEMTVTTEPGWSDQAYASADRLIAGQSWSGGGFSCEVSEAGVLCYNRIGSMRVDSEYYR